MLFIQIYVVLLKTIYLEALNAFRSVFLDTCVIFHHIIMPGLNCHKFSVLFVALYFCFCCPPSLYKQQGLVVPSIYLLLLLQPKLILYKYAPCSLKCTNLKGWSFPSEISLALYFFSTFYKRKHSKFLISPFSDSL